MEQGFARHKGRLRCVGCGEVGLELDQGRAVCAACGRDHGAADDILDLAPHLPDTVATADQGPAHHWLDQVVRQRTVQAVTGLDYGGEAEWMRTRCVPGEGAILELACGGGREARVLSGIFGGDRVIALDVHRSTLLRAQETSRGHAIWFVRGDAHRLPFGDGTLGAVNSFGALHLVADPAATVAEVGRVLAPGGTFTGQASLRRDEGISRFLHAALAPVTHNVDARTLRGWCQRAGLTNVEIVHHRGIGLFAATKAM